MINLNINIDVSRNSIIRNEDMNRHETNFRPRDCIESVANRRIENTTRKKIDYVLMTLYTITLMYLIGLISIVYVDPWYMDQIFSNIGFVFLPFVIGFVCFSMCNIGSMCCYNINCYDCLKMYRCEISEN